MQKKKKTKATTFVFGNTKKIINKPQKSKYQQIKKIQKEKLTNLSLLLMTKKLPRYVTQEVYIRYLNKKPDVYTH